VKRFRRFEMWVKVGEILIPEYSFHIILDNGEQIVLGRGERNSVYYSIEIGDIVVKRTQLQVNSIGDKRWRIKYVWNNKIIKSKQSGNWIY
jgi:hypothetical protein